MNTPEIAHSKQQNGARLEARAADIDKRENILLYSQPQLDTDILLITNLYCGVNYADAFELCKTYGGILRMRIIIEKEKQKLGLEKCYVKYSRPLETHKAFKALDNINPIRII